MQCAHRLAAQALKRRCSADAPSGARRPAQAAYGVGVRTPSASASTEATLPVSGLPPALDGLRIGLLTDIHHSALVPRRRCGARGRPALIAQKPGSDRPRRRLRDLRRPRVRRAGRRAAGAAAAPHGVFAILGNHDDDRDMPAALARRGIRGAEGSSGRASTFAARRSTGGHPFLDARPATSQACSQGRADTVVAARARSAAAVEAAALNVPAVLSGHTHGGQVVLPGLGALARAQFPVLAGLGRREQHVDLRQPRDRNGLRAGADQLPAGSRARHAAARQSSDLTNAPAFDPPSAIEHQLRRPRDTRGAPRRECAPPASRRVSSSSTGTARCSDDRPGIELARHEVHGHAARP